MNQKFCILWIEDNDRVISKPIPAIEKLLAEKGIELKLLKDPDGEKFPGYIDNEPIIDIIVTDYNITDEVKGTDVIEKIREKKRVTDILFYSVHEEIFNDKLFKQMGRCGMIRVWEGKNVEEPLLELIKKNLEKFDDIVFLRGFIISKSVDLEIKLNGLFTCYFKIKPELIEDFHNFILESSNVPMFGKQKWISKLLKKMGLENDEEFKGLITKFSKIAEDRNLLAHCREDVENPKILYSSGKEEKFDRNRINGILTNIHECESRIEKLRAKCST